MGSEHQHVAVLIKGQRSYQWLTETHLGLLYILDARCMRGDDARTLGDWINAIDGAKLRRHVRYAAYWIQNHHQLTEGENS